jgi:hypothetical protein
MLNQPTTIHFFLVCEVNFLNEEIFSGKLLFKIVSLNEFNDSFKLSVFLFDKVSLSIFS